VLFIFVSELELTFNSIYLIVLGEFAHSGAYVHLEWSTGKAEMASVLSFGAIVFGFATGWTSYAADYTVYQAVTNSRRKVFLATWLGLIVPLLFTELLGAAIISATKINNGVNPYADGYAQSAVGGLLAAVLFPPLGGFGKFCLVILALSIIGNNIPNIYSVALTLQVLGRWTQRVPRFIWVGM
jgi:purine-cytosine permease-like protein